jgi:hypothetical protein
MASLVDLISAATRVIANRSANSGAAVIGGTATAFSTGAAINYTIDGIYRQLAAQTNTAFAPLVAADLPAISANYTQPSGLPGFYTQPANTTVYYVLCVNAAGAVRVVQGTVLGAILPAQFGIEARGDGKVPPIPDGVAPFAVIRVVSGGSVFTPGTTALTGIATFFNVEYVPVNRRP